MRLRPLMATTLTLVSFVMMVVVVSQYLPVEHRWHGGWIWFVAWLPTVLILVMTIAVEWRDDSSLWQWLLTSSVAYGSLVIAMLWQHQSIWLLLTQAGFMEATGLGLGHGLALAWIGLRERHRFGDFFFPQLFGLAFLLAVLWVAGVMLWQTHIITWLTIPGLVLASGLRGWSLSRTFQAILTR